MENVDKAVCEASPSLNLKTTATNLVGWFSAVPPSSTRAPVNELYWECKGTSGTLPASPLVVWDQPITMPDCFSPRAQINSISLRCRGDHADQLLLVSFCWIERLPACLSYLADNTPAPHTTSERLRASFSRLALWMSVFLALFFLSGEHLCFSSSG